eukprot:6541675-Pyramimonas_sp.AAC.1
MGWPTHLAPLKATSPILHVAHIKARHTRIRASLDSTTAHGALQPTISAIAGWLTSLKAGPLTSPRADHPRSSLACVRQSHDNLQLQLAREGDN